VVEVDKAQVGVSLPGTFQRSSVGPPGHELMTFLFYPPDPLFLDPLSREKSCSNHEIRLISYM